MSQALYRKYRSQTLDEVLGQDHVTSILKASLRRGKISHAYLLTGPRGVGKTSVARILAHQINNLDYPAKTPALDIIEIDAASNNGVDDIRSLREKAQVLPVSAPKKIYIIDEVHMLSKPAFNALLKTLEEPPAHVVFIMATTDADKLPDTIISRVQQFYFQPISQSVIADHLMNIASQEGFLLDQAAAELIAEQSKGGFRDSISLLDQLSVLADGSTPLGAEMVAKHLGLSDTALVEKLISSYQASDPKSALECLIKAEELGLEPLVLTRQLLSSLRTQLVRKPELSSLLQQLIEVTKHPHPELKLFTIFARPDTKAAKPKTIAQIARSTATISRAIVPVEDESDEADEVQEPAPIYYPETAVGTTTKPIETEKPARKLSNTASVVKKPATKKLKSAPVETLDWAKVLESAKSQSIGVYTLLGKCDYTYEQGRLTIYCSNKFNKKKLDDSKNQPIIHHALAQTGASDIEITLIGSTKPPTDERLAKIAAMMGGGQEVKLEESQ